MSNRTRPWQIGDKVRYVRTIEWGPAKGETGVIESIREKDIGKPGNEHQMFWVQIHNGRYCTLPSDVVLVEADT